jgi:ribosomal protein S6--L-glutamate ligase
MNIYVLNNFPNHSSTQKLVETGKKRGHKVSVLEYDNLYLYLSESTTGHDRIYNNETRLQIKDIDAVISRMGNNLDYGLAVLEHLQNNMKIYCTSSADGLRIAADKFLTSQKLSQAKVQVPKTVFAYKPKNPDFLVDKVGGLPCIAKTIKGSQGVGVMILESKLQTNTTLEAMYKSDMQLQLQQFLEAGAKDIRVIVVDNQIVGAMERTANKGDFRANLSKGGEGKSIELTQDEKDMAIKAAQAVGLGSFAGVDLLRANDKTYCIEVNGNPGDKFIEITGINFYENLFDMIEKAKGFETPQTEQAKTLLKGYSFTGKTGTFMSRGGNEQKIFIYQNASGKTRALHNNGDTVYDYSETSKQINILNP